MPEFDAKNRPYFSNSSKSLALANELGFSPMFIGKDLLTTGPPEIKPPSETPLPQFPTPETQVPKESKTKSLPL